MEMDYLPKCIRRKNIEKLIENIIEEYSEKKTIENLEVDILSQ